MTPRLSMIVAVANHSVIGRGQDMAWHIRSDLRRFRSMTEGKTIIVGRETFEHLRHAYESRNKPLPERKQVILTKNLSYHVDLPDCFVCHTVEEAISKAYEIEKVEILVVGGGTIFSQMIDRVERLYLTKVELDVDGDVFFPNYSQFSKVISDEPQEEDGIKFRYLTLERV